MVLIVVVVYECDRLVGMYLGVNVDQCVLVIVIQVYVVFVMFDYYYQIIVLQLVGQNDLIIGNGFDFGVFRCGDNYFFLMQFILQLFVILMKEWIVNWLECLIVW